MSSEAPEDKFVIQKNDKVGRFAVASESLKPGDLIFTELPFVYGPKSDTPPLCLGCYTPVDCSTLCTSCGWPVCSPDCEILDCHKKYECEIFSKNGVKFQGCQNPGEVCLQYECITPFRMLLAKEQNPKRWDEEISKMEHHNIIRKEKPIWPFNQTNVVQYLRGPCKLDRFPEELIHTCCGILEINAFEARSLSGYPIRCLFPKLALLSHNCVSNILHSVDCTGLGDLKDFQVYVRATTEIPKNGELFSSYTYSLWPTLIRREFLRESKFFECTCPRCSDKTELGTHMSTLKCNKCDNGIVMAENPLDDFCEWKCTHCDFKTHGQAVKKVFQTIQSEIDLVEGLTDAEGIEARETIFKKYRSVLHPKNAYMTILRTALSQLYGKAEGYTLEDLPDLILERKVELCRQLLENLDIVEPGYSRIRGITLYELHSPVLILARNLYTSGGLSKQEFKSKIEESIRYLEESANILKNEPQSSVEGQLGIVAGTACEQLKQNINVLIDSA